MRKNIGLICSLGLTAILFSACSDLEKAETIDMDALTVEIQAMEDGYSSAEKAKDADAVVVYYSDDAITYGSNRQPDKGKAAIRKFHVKQIANDTLGGYNVYKVVDLFAEGESVVEIGSWTEYDANGVEVENGHYMSYFQKRDGKYVCVRDMSNTTKPLE